MRNTLIPLDLVVSSDCAGCGQNIPTQFAISARTNLRWRGAVMRCLAVLEINGGLSARHGITTGHTAAPILPFAGVIPRGPVSSSKNYRSVQLGFSIRLLGAK